MKNEESEPALPSPGKLLEQIEERTDQSNLQVQQANIRTDEANTRTDLANTRTDEANVRTELAVDLARGVRASEVQYRRLFETAKDGILILDAETGMIVDVNPFLEELLGYSHAEFLGKKVWELGFLKDLFPNQVKFRELQEKEYVRYENLPLESSKGRRIEVEFVSNLYLVDHQKVIQCNIRDISVRRRLENALREQERILTESQRLGHVGSWFHDMSGPLKWSEEMYRIYGVSRENFTPTVESSLGLMHPDDRPAMQRWTASCAAGEKPSELEFRARRPDGTIRFMNGAGDAVFDAGNKILHMAGTVHDITERKVAEEELQNLRLAVEQSANAVVMTDTGGDIRYVNPAFEKMTGYTKADVVGRNSRLLRSGEQSPEFYRALWQTITAGKIWRGAFHNRRKDGSLYWESATISPVVGESGELRHFIAIKEDITKQRAMEDGLKDALIAAEAGNRAKSKFLSIMSHELRTPINGVLGCTELLTFTTLDEEQKTLADTVARCGEHLLAIIKDILDFSSFEAGALKIHTAPMAVADSVELSMVAVRPAAAAKGLELRSESHPEVPHHINGDALRIRQILINLLSNAVKFTSEGSVVLRVKPDAEGRFLDFSILDTGIGMANDTIGLLFLPFTQLDSTTTRAFGGTGLGLAISKRLAEAMGGEIQVISDFGKGSTFTLRLPMEAATVCGGDQDVGLEENKGDLTAPRGPAGIEESTEPTDAKIVLLVEDDPENALTAGKMLESLGFRAEFASNGAEALEACRLGKYFAVLMDVVMPVMDGIEATRRIRQLEFGSNIPIIALTANVMPGDRDRCMAAGMDDFLPKPFKRNELASKLAAAAKH